jgi:uncharacterized protein
MADKRKRGFAAMDPEKRREAQRLGGLTTHRLGKAHTFTLEEMRKGGLAVSRDRAYMAKIGRRGLMSPRRQRAKTKDRNGKE